VTIIKTFSKAAETFRNSRFNFQAIKTSKLFMSRLQTLPPHLVPDKEVDVLLL
jgi:hypothetical protein